VNCYNTSDYYLTARSLQSRLFGLWWDNDNADIYMNGNYNYNYAPRNLFYYVYAGVVDYNTHTMYRKMCYDNSDLACFRILNAYHRADRTGGDHGIDGSVSY
jgi:hypothetical protein